MTGVPERARPSNDDGQGTRSADTRARGRLRVYLGAAPGVGKTVAMLSEGRRRAARGTNVLVAVMESHGREFTAEQVGELPVVPRRALSHRGVQLSEMDLRAVLDRRPQVALVDELAHTNAPGSGNEKRWQDVDELLAAGIDVITTVNIQHLESLNDVVAAITGVVQTETVPDEVVRAAEQIELVDMTPQALRRRMAHGHIYPADRIDTALGNYFREGNLTALRELALLWVADRVEEGLDRYRAEHGIRGTWAARDRVVVALTGGPEGPLLLRRGARIAGRVAGRSLIAVHVVRSDGSVGTSVSEIEKQRLLAENLGGSLQLVVGDDIAATVLEFARTVNGTQIVVGASRHGRFAQLVRPSTSNAIVRGSGDIDVYVVTHQKAASSHRQWSLPRIGRSGPWPWIAAVLIPGALAALVLPLRHDLALSTVLLIFLLGVLANALIGGVLPAAIAAVIAGVLANLLFTPPYGSLTISQPENAFALVVFVVVGVTVASVVDRSAVRASQATRGRAEAQLVASVATSIVHAADAVHAVLDQARVGFGMTSVVLLSTAEPGLPRPVSVAGVEVPTTAGGGINPDGADVAVAAGANWILALYGRPLTPADRTLVEVFAAQAVLAVERDRLTAEARQGERLRQADRVRTAVLAALSHDLRTPLATIKASVSSLRDRSIAWTEEDQTELLAATDEAADQLDALLANLLDLSRLQTGVLVPVRRPTSVDEVVHRALIGIPIGRIRDAIPDDLPLIDTDAGLLERVIANITANAVRHSPDGRPVRLLAGQITDEQGSRVQIRVVDSGPGVAEVDREAMFAPFQRLGDVPQGSGVGLGLAVARGLAEAVEATIEVEDTPGGGLTMIVTVPVAGPRESVAQTGVGTNGAAS
jgi:two-component system sensor histidine kinase KdpD